MGYHPIHDKAVSQPTFLTALTIHNLFIKKIILLETSFKYEFNDIIYVTYNFLFYMLNS
jgi:hypothetical protein